MSRDLALAAALLATAPAAAQQFDPIEFFRGRTHGDGVLKVLFQPSKPIKVDSLGYAEKDGTLIIKQAIHEQGKAQRVRYWRLRQVAPGRFEGTLTDAVGPVRIEQAGDSVRIRYRSKDHLAFDQTLTPSSPRSVANHLRVKRFGIVVARLDETIRKVD